MTVAIGLVASLLPAASVAAGNPDHPLEERDIADAVENELGHDGIVDLNSIDVRVDDGVVELTGVTRTLLARDRAAEIFWSPYVESENITVSVDDGEATLTGTVDSWFEYRHVAENAFQAGAAAIDNRLSVQGPES